MNMKGEVEMDALVMDGRTLACGAVSAVRRVANPIHLARLVMDKVMRVYVYGYTHTPPTPSEYLDSSKTLSRIAEVDLTAQGG